MWKFGHRGACGHAPENTLASMKKALELGVHGFEFDIQMSKDGQPVIIHDDTLERTTSGKGKVEDYTLEQLQAFDAGGGEKIPSLQNALDLVDQRCKLLIELKHEHCAPPVVDIITHYVTRMGWSYEQLIVCAFNHLQIAQARALNPNIRTCALFVGIPVSLAEIASDAGAWAINPNVHHMNRALIDDARARNLKIITWTANDPRHIAYAQSMGVDGIISDFPDRL